MMYSPCLMSLNTTLPFSDVALAIWLPSLFFKTNLAPVKRDPSSPFLTSSIAPFKPVQDTVTLSLFIFWYLKSTSAMSCLPATGVA